MSILRVSFRLAGMRAEILHLVEESFSGEALYWHDGDELRRKMLHVETKADVNGNYGFALLEERKRKNTEYATECLKTMDAWCTAHESGQMKVYFTRGEIRRMEY